MNKYQEDYKEFIKSLKYIDELVDSLTIEQRKSLGATTYSIQGVLGRYINEEKDFIKALVDKEAPLKPFLGDCFYRQCEKCKSGLQSSHNWIPDYCSGCGQKIDWGEEE